MFEFFGLTVSIAIIAHWLAYLEAVQAGLRPPQASLPAPRTGNVVPFQRPCAPARRA